MVFHPVMADELVKRGAARDAKERGQRERICHIYREDGTLVMFMAREDYNNIKNYGENMGLGDFGNSQVTVDKNKLLSMMRTNLTKHREQFLEAQEGYREEVIKRLDSMLQDARDKKKHIRVVVELEAPEDHSSEYETNIAMLEWSINETLTITQQQFNQFVLDKWGWSDRFRGTNAVYSKK